MKKTLLLVIASLTIISCTFDPEAFKQFSESFAGEFGEYQVNLLAEDCGKKYIDKYSDEKKEAQHYYKKARDTKDYGQKANYIFLQAKHTAQAANRAKAVIECYEEIVRIQGADSPARIAAESWKEVARIEERTSNQLAVQAGLYDRM